MLEHPIDDVPSLDVDEPLELDEDETAAEPSEAIWATATIHMAGKLRPGRAILVDPDSEFIQMCFDRAYLIPNSEEQGGGA